MADDLDIAAEREQLARDAALYAHAHRPVTPVGLCADCESSPCHVTSKNVTWRFCFDCGESRRRSQ